MRLPHALLAGLLAGACATMPVPPSADPAERGAPPVGEAPWLAAPGPGWTILVREQANTVVMVNDASIARSDGTTRAVILINFINPMQAIAGRAIRSELAELEVACAARAYRRTARRLFDSHGATGASLLAVPEGAEVPMRPVIPGSIAEDLHAALCAAPPAERAPGRAARDLQGVTSLLGPSHVPRAG